MTILLSQSSKNKRDTRKKELARIQQRKEFLENTEITERLWTKAKIPVKFHPEYLKEKLESKNDNSKKWQEKKKNIQTKFGKGFLIGLLGDRGRGKTQMASSLIHEACSEQINCLYVKTREFFFRIREAYQKEGPPEFEILKEFIDPKFLVIDEIGERGGTDWEDKTLIYLIDKRYEEMKDTLLISNQTQEEFFVSVGISIQSRMSETGGIIKCDWESFRKKEEK